MCTDTEYCRVDRTFFTRGRHSILIFTKFPSKTKKITMSQGGSSGDEHDDTNALESLLANQQFLSVAMRRQILKQMVSIRYTNSLSPLRNKLFCLKFPHVHLNFLLFR